MKLRNKKTGEVTEIEEINLVVWNAERDCYESFEEYHSLAELNEEWEDYKPKEEKPKRYRLKKDLPTFKAGDEFFTDPYGSLWLDQEIDGEPNSSRVMAYNHSTLEKFPNILENWFEPIEPAEPLIKDEKIRKAIKYIFPEFALIYIEKQGGSRIFRFGGTRLEIYAPDENAITHGCSYLVDELCGEEE